ncbi:MAG: hypothetical protein ACTSYA_12725 [Candidatus Kariarchaeaceae archaeon]
MESSDKNLLRKQLLIFVLLLVNIIVRLLPTLSSKTLWGVDAWDYIYYIKQSVISSQIVSPELHIPGFYILISSYCHILDIDPETAYLFLPQIILGLLTIEMFILARALTKDDSAGIIVLLLTSSGGVYVLRTMLVIPESFGLSLIPLGLWLYWKMFTIRTKEWSISFLMIGTTIVTMHHLSGGVFLCAINFITLWFSLSNNHRKDIWVSVIFLNVITLGIWSLTSNNYPFMVAQRGSQYFLIIALIMIILSIVLFSIIAMNPKIIKLYQSELVQQSWSYVLFTTIILLSLWVGLRADLSFQIIASFLPISLFIPFTLVCFHKDSFQIMHARSFFLRMIFSYFILFSLIALNPAIQTLLGRYAEFLIQIAVLGTAMGASIKLKKKDGRRKLYGFTIALLMITNFPLIYPNPDIWMGTTFNYNGEELEAAEWLETRFKDLGLNPERALIDTDNRLGVMLWGHVGVNSSCGEPGDSELAHLLSEKLSLAEIASYRFSKHYFIFLSQVIVDSTFAMGKFGHGRTFSTSDIALEVGSDFINALNQHPQLTKVLDLDSVWIWKIGQ